MQFNAANSITTYLTFESLGELVLFYNISQATYFWLSAFLFYLIILAYFLLSFSLSKSLKCNFPNEILSQTQNLF